jgi:hypothetical protein
MTEKMIDMLQLALTALEVYWLTGDAAMTQTADSALRELAEATRQQCCTLATVQQ